MSKPKPTRRSRAPKQITRSGLQCGLRVRKYPDGSVLINPKRGKEVLLSIGSDGAITTIYDDDFVDLYKEGRTEIIRASHVEPSEDGKGWIADMRPIALKFGISGDWNLKLGPFTLRNDALQAERQWIVERILA